MKRFFLWFGIIVGIVMIPGGSIADQSLYGVVPVNIQVNLFLKILNFYNGIPKDGKITIHVVNAPDFAMAAKSAKGRRVGKVQIDTLTQGSALPAIKPTVIYIGNSPDLDQIIQYCQSEKVMSITGIPSLVSQGITLGLGTLGGKPKILLNLVSSKAEGLRWNPAILKIATRVDS